MDQAEAQTPKPSINKLVTIAIVVTSVLVVIGGGVLLYLLLSRGRATQQIAIVDSAGKPVDVSTIPMATPSADELVKLASRISTGDTAAARQLERAAEDMYRGINYQKEQPRVITNLKLMRAAFDPLGAEAGKGNAKVMDAFKSWLKTRSRLASFVPDALGAAAAAGNKEALDILLDYKKNNILESSAVFAMRKPAEANDPRAIKFMVDVINDDKAKPLWHAAASGLRNAADAGNADAKAAVERSEQSR